MSENILNILKAECNKLIESNIYLERITEKILSPSNKCASTWIYFTSLSLICAIALFYIFPALQHVSNFREVRWSFRIISRGILGASISSLIVTVILTIPIHYMLESHRKKRFDKYKDELKPVLFDIRNSLDTIYNSKIKIEFINEPCLREISRYMEKDGNTVDEAVKRFEEEKYNSKEFVHKKKIAEIRCKNLLALDKLSKTPHVTSSLQMWTNLYSPIWETIEDYGITRKK